MPVLKERHSEPIPGYKLVERLGSGGFGQVWKCVAPGGIHKAIKFVYGDLNSVDGDGARAGEELRAIEHVKSIRHPFLLSIDRVESIDGELMIVTELADQNLHQLFNEFRKNGGSGIPRDDLLRYVEEAAEILDVMNLECNLQHLDVKPSNIFLVRNHVKVADFGLVNQLGAAGNISGSGVHLGAITPIYASPELFHGKVSRRSDQYSLAVAYQELLTGQLPFNGTNPRQLLLAHTQKTPNLEPLSAVDRDAVARALSKNPDDRFPSCLDFIRALQEKHTKATVSTASTLSTMPHHRHGNQAEPDTATNLHDTGELRETGPSSTVIPGYRFIESVGHSPLSDIWRVQDDDANERCIKLIYGVSFDKNEKEEIVTRLESLDHPALLREQILRAEPGRLVLLSNPVKESLRDRFQQFRRRKLPGIVRGELLEYMRAAAEALDFLYLQHSILHLGLNPKKMILDRGWLQMAEFGFAQLLWMPAKQDIARCNARYAAPELWNGTVHRTCDQFSLAVIYAEMLTGIHPFTGSTKRAAGNAPNLEKLPQQDRDVIAKALDVDPRKRWTNATDMVMALEGVHDECDDDRDPFISLVTQTPVMRSTATNAETTQTINRFLADLITKHGGEVLDNTANMSEMADDGDTLHYEFNAELPLGSARVRLDELASQWFAMDVRDSDEEFRFTINMPSNFWRQWIGGHERLEICIALDRVQAMSPTPIRVTVHIRAVSANERRRRQWLEEIGPELLDSVQDALLVNSEKRMQDRILWPHTVTVIPIEGDGRHGEPVECRGKDISLRGMGIYLPEDLPTADVLLRVPNTLHPPEISIPATLVRAKRCADGWYEVGALFRLPGVRKSSPELSLADISN